MAIQSDSTKIIEPPGSVALNHQENDARLNQKPTSNGEKKHEGCPPVAIVGMALRVPGGVKSPDELWKFLLEKKNGVCEVPGSRYNIDAFYSENKTHTVKTRHGYYLDEDPASFDASFFSITKEEAEQMDPQQRKLMEVFWECLESAGETDWKGKNIGCYVGVYGEDWLDLASKDPQYTSRFHILGTGQFALSNRLSWEYDFRGPSMTIQTGCSASLVGLHEACQALYSGECSSAIVGGTSLIFAPTMTATMSDNTVMSPTGICRTFDAGADGYGRAEAINALYIKRLDDALRNNDPIRGIIRSTSLNFDGRTPTITTPGSESQEALIRRAYESAGISDISQTGCFECHGTGTVAGDTAEVSVVAKVFEGKGVVITGIKPNIGHGEGASGISSVIKGVMALEHDIIPPNVFFETPNPRIPFKEGNLQVPVEALPWPENRSKRVSVNSFGVGGANAHTILESTASFCGIAAKSSPVQCDGPRLLTVSAKNANKLKERIQATADYLNEGVSKLHDLAYTLGVRREHLPHRAFTIAQPGQPVSPAGFHTGQDKSPDLTFVFTGQGAQWSGMGQDLLNSFPDARKDVQALDKALQDLPNGPNWTLEEELSKTGDDSRVNEAEFSQPLCTALQIALVNIFNRWGIRPSSVVGHSSGEITAAYAAGAITSESAIIIAYCRGKATKELKRKGAMAAIGLGRDKVTRYLEDGVVIACENSPQSVTLSGEAATLENVMASIKKDLPDAFCRRLRVSVAYHSHHMRELGPSYESSISPFIRHNEKMLPLFSTVASKSITRPHELDAAYWRSNLESPVLFSGAVQSILQASRKTAFLEIGPHGALSGPLRQIFQAAGLKSPPVYVPTLDRNETDSRPQLLAAAGSIHVCGVSVDLASVNGKGNTLGNLPPYPWDHDQKFWYASRLTNEWRFRAYPHHELLGSLAVEASGIEPLWRNVLRLDDVPWLIEHNLQGDIIFPATGYISMAGEAIRQIFPDPDAEDYTIRNLLIKSPMVLRRERETEVITAFKPSKITDLVDSEWYSFTIMSHDGAEWTKHCQGEVKAGPDNPRKGHKIPTYNRAVDAALCYKMIDRAGFNYGPRFRRFKDISVHLTENRASAKVTELQEKPVSRYALHPATMDHVLQLFPINVSKGLPRLLYILVPASLGKIYVRGSSSELSIETVYTHNNNGVLVGNATMMEGDELALTFDDCIGFPVAGFGNFAGGSETSLCSQIRWAPDIDFIPSQVLLPTLSAPESYRAMAGDIEQLSVLYILETADKLASIKPTDSFLNCWKNWVVSKASSLRQLPETLPLEAHEWTQMSSECRKERIKTLASRYTASEEDHSVPFECMQYIYENCERLIEEKDLSKETTDYLERYRGFIQSHCDWSPFLTSLAHSNPSMRVLEIGGGRGHATQVVLKHLRSPEGSRMFSHYMFTDSSDSIIQAAKEVVTDGVEHKVLDIAKDPSEQGFKLHSFDLVIASNALNSTPQVQEPLKNIHKLLASGGRVLFQEMQPGVLSTTYIMGLLPSWQSSEDGRLEQPCLSPAQWEQEFHAAGFSGAEAISYDLDTPHQTSFSVLSSVKAAPAPLTDVTLLVGESPGPWAKEVADTLGEAGHQIHWGRLDLPPPTSQCIISLLDLDGPYLYDLSEEKYAALHLYMSQIGKSRLIWVTSANQLTCNDPRFSLIFGFARTLRGENGLDISTFETDTFNGEAVNGLVKVLSKIEQSRALSALDPEYEFAFHHGTIHTGRCHWISPQSQMPIQSLGETPRKLSMKAVGSIDSLYWQPFDGPKELTGNDVEIDIHYVGLNFRDIMVAVGLFGDPDEFGIEGSGIVRRVAPGVVDFKPGDKVIVIDIRSFRTQIVRSADLIVPVPEGLTLEDASTMPCVYFTSILCLDWLARVKKGESVLIHSACGGVGLSAIQVCKVLGAEVFVTVGSEEKVQYLMDEFGIPRHRIFNSRNADFLPCIMKETDGRGVDVVLNSLTGKLLHASWRCVAPFGKMVELGKRDFLGNGRLDLAPMIENRSFIGFDLGRWINAGIKTWKRMTDQFLWWYNQESIKPIRPIKVYDATDIVEAFRYMQQGTHMGKIVIRIPQDRSAIPLTGVKAPVRFSPEVSYLLVGGLGGLGRSISSWMVEQGARHLVYLSRTAGQTEKDQAFMQELKDQGCHTLCVAGSVLDIADVRSAISQCPKPLAGVLQLSTVLKDRTFNKMSYEDWTTCLETKVQGTWNLHSALENEKNLDFFVMFGSVAGVCGNVGQANYAAANGFLSSFTQYRRQLGLPASVLELGIVDEIGMASDNDTALRNARSASLRLVYEYELIEGVRLAIHQCRNPPAADSMTSSSCIIGLGNTKPLSEMGVRPLWPKDARFALYSNLEGKYSGEGNEAANNDVKLLLSNIGQSASYLSTDECKVRIQAILASMVRQNLPHTQDMEDDEVAGIHIDSLMAIEMRNWIRRHLGLEVTLVEISKAGIIEKLADTIHHLMKIKYGVAEGQDAAEQDPN
ncbi:fatty acid synthase S-acetyltransferase [Nannizzia gypsea CBS 118893]|uniref:Non-reducing polyketide synthase nscA n=1 Tax=Arthroderma gypseum (strain ATCC MYA-4604 / CBS 118893) TaxID=535722 RepID=E4V6W5_ARTGP|nr:fatty acid synthase S-acetyltransferase [Nannizzia gypsea CBS 118893]EFQ96831.1 fatty acid synthase S-acetyltransferase [Nannizzia gypsea CBS 118893]